MKIEKGKKPKKNQLADTLKRMSVGDSVLLVDDRQYNSCYIWFSRNGKKCRREMQADGRIRLWRVE